MVVVFGVALSATKVGFCRVDSIGSLSFYSSTLGHVGRPTGGLYAELTGVLRVQSLPALEAHRFASGDAANRRSAEQVIENIESNMPTSSTHRDESPIDFVPER